MCRDQSKSRIQLNYGMIALFCVLILSYFLMVFPMISLHKRFLSVFKKGVWSNIIIKHFNIDFVILIYKMIIW